MKLTALVVAALPAISAAFGYLPDPDAMAPAPTPGGYHFCTDPTDGADYGYSTFGCSGVFPDYDTATCTITEGGNYLYEAVQFWTACRDAAEAYYGHISTWDVGDVTDFSNVFSGYTDFNDDITNWDVSSATNMYGMFQYATAFNQDLSNWDISSVTDMRYMFEEAYAFNQWLCWPNLNIDYDDDATLHSNYYESSGGYGYGSGNEGHNVKVFYMFSNCCTCDGCSGGIDLHC